MSTKLSAPKAVLFDLGGTILEFDTYIDATTGNDGAERTLELAIENPYGITVDKLRELTGEINEEFEEKRRLGNIEYPADLLDRHVFEPYGLRFAISSEELSEEVFRHTHKGARVEPGAEQVFDQLQNANIPMGIVSNSGFTARAVFTHIREFGLDR
jgi:FMN phosphatase YigB (HAD superfamily)